MSLFGLVVMSGWPEGVAAGLAVASLVHLSTTLLLVLRRVFLLTRARLYLSGTGSERRRSA